MATLSTASATVESSASDATSTQPMKRRVSFDLRHNEVSYLPSQQVLDNLVRAKEYLERSHSSTDPAASTTPPECKSISSDPGLDSKPPGHEPTLACLPETPTATNTSHHRAVPPVPSKAKLKSKAAKSASRRERTCQYWVRQAGLTLNTAITSIIVHHGKLCTTDSLSPQQRKLATQGLHTAAAAAVTTADLTSAARSPKGVLKPQPPPLTDTTDHVHDSQDSSDGSAKITARKDKQCQPKKNKNKKKSHGKRTARH